jgi:hypothetical protein
MPSSIKAYGEEVLANPLQFDIVTAGGRMQFETVSAKILKLKQNIFSKELLQKNEIIDLVTRSEVEPDGWMKYYFIIKALAYININDIKLIINFNRASLNSDRIKITAPEINNFQEGRELKLD